AEYANRQVGTVSYVLVDLNEFAEVQQRYLDGGYVKLGESDFSWGYGIPQREAAISYARFIGADAVLYSVKTYFDYNLSQQRISHSIGFYAHKYTGGARLSFTAPSGSSLTQIEQAENEL